MDYFISFIIKNQYWLRGFFFIGGLLLFMLWGLKRPFRQSNESDPKMRWLTNFVMAVLGVILLRVFVPIELVALSYKYSISGALKWLNEFPLIKILVAVVLMDFAIYWQHRVFHVVPMFWLLHRVHHSDVYFDTSLAIRFHPVEILISYLYKAALVVTLGVPPAAVILYEIVLNFSAMFNHGNFSFKTQTEM